MTFVKNTWFFLFLVIITYVSLHLFGVGLPLHQDEYKWVQYSHPEIIPPGTVPHPPLTEFIYTKFAPIFTDNGFRFVPTIFGLANLFLLFYLLEIIFDRKTAKIGAFLFVTTFYSLLSTLMVDVDGAVMPFFFLILLIGYFKLKTNGFSLETQNYKWLILITLGTVGGFLIKVSFFIAIASVFFDFLISKDVFKDRVKILKYATYGFTGIVFLGFILYFSKLIFPFFNLEYAFGYWKHFIVWDRGWMQTFIQCIKAVLYLSPLLVFLPGFISREDLHKTRVFLIFLIFSFIFYIVLFDFSIGALDRYLQLAIVPLVVFSSTVISKSNFLREKRTKEFFILGLIFSLVILILQSVTQYAPPLHPKTDWIMRVFSFKWNFLYPFSGGSGPLGFYISFIVIGISWVLVFLAFIYSKFKISYKNLIIAFIIPIGFIYNFIFIEEYLFGFWNGHAGRLLDKAVMYIDNNPDIKMVTVYNDNGGNEIQQIGKYRKRLYVDPKFDIKGKVENLNKYKEHYFVLDVPRINPDTVYAKYFNSCNIIYKDIDKYISATVYDCSRAPDIKI